MKLKFPLPSVLITCPLLPSDEGNKSPFKSNLPLPLASNSRFSFDLVVEILLSAIVIASLEIFPVTATFAVGLKVPVVVNVPATANVCPLGTVIVLPVEPFNVSTFNVLIYYFS